ncbi:apolipoprotein D-like [Calliopsis andreniformis]|uniref:apolipoprotein D-like n=1 Tax=Calliopsis andreniformis TaxID=337506 RepID=UPI003FCC289F
MGRTEGVVAARSTLLPSPVNVYKARGSNYAHGRSPADMIGKIVLVLSTLAVARAQVPSLGFCPDYVPMAEFDMAKFIGVWYEAERYFQLTEVVSRCVMANYTLGPDGKFRVSNEVTNRFTGIKRVVEGEIRKPASKAEEGKLTVKYTIPLSPESKYSVLETDYDTYAVLWSCSGIGPFHTQNAWIMTRERVAPNPVMQKAYAVLDRYKISKTFFVKTDQEDCALLDKPLPAQPAAEGPQPAESQNENAGKVRFAIPDAPQIIVELNKEKEEKNAIPAMADKPKKKPVNTVPELIMEAADAMKEDMLMDSSEVVSESKKNEAKEEESFEKGQEMKTA